MMVMMIRVGFVRPILLYNSGMVLQRCRRWRVNPFTTAGVFRRRPCSLRRARGRATVPAMMARPGAPRIVVATGGLMVGRRRSAGCNILDFRDRLLAPLSSITLERLVPDIQPRQIGMQRQVPGNMSTSMTRARHWGWWPGRRSGVVESTSETVAGGGLVATARVDLHGTGSTTGRRQWTLLLRDDLVEAFDSWQPRWMLLRWSIYSTERRSSRVVRLVRLVRGLVAA